MKARLMNRRVAKFLFCCCTATGSFIPRTGRTVLCFDLLSVAVWKEI